MVFTQYGSLFTVVLFTLFLLPAVLMNLLGKKIKLYGMLLNIPMLFLLLGLNTIQFKQFILFIAGELVLIMGYYLFRKRVNSEFIYFCVLFASMWPIILVKGCIYTSYNMLGFVGISYISFRVWQLIIEIKDNHIKKLSIWDVFYFITFFPTISSGPIDRYERFMSDVEKKIPRNEYPESYLFQGLSRILRGAIYKFGIAFLINYYILEALSEDKTIFSTIIYMYAYTIYLFFDFAGYSHFAIGTSYILGIRVGENFNKPFLAHNMKEFWERWHISLSQWFGDYIYKRFVLNTLRNGTFKSRKVASRIGNLVTMTIMGLWHGPHLFYLLYGVYEGLTLVITDVYLKSKKYKQFKQSKLYTPLSRFVCFHVIAFGMLIFSGYLLSI